MQSRTPVAVAPSEPLGHAPSPSPRSPTKDRRLSPSMIISATGQESLEELEELEVIFGGVSELGGLERCTSLRSLTLIDCGLRRISNLEPVGHSLIKLCLCDQGLKRMEGLCLPGLRELYLHQNRISKIEGLQGCPSLRRLWLFSNRISAMEGLHHCGALRELWLHDNRISSAAGMQSLVHLQNLGLAGNPIVGVRHLSGLRGLPSLMELTLDDIHFGTCPVVKEEGYRSFVVCCLRQVRRLDGLEVMEADRAEVEHKYEQEALAYQERLEEIERRRLGEIQQAEMARDGGAERGTEVKAEMMRALDSLEGLVREGRASIARERSRQEEVQTSNLLELESNLSELQRQYCKEVDKRIQAEEAKAKEEERLFSALEERTRLECDYAQLVARQQSRVVDGVAVQELSDHSPDFQRLRAVVRDSQTTRSGQVELMNVLRACRLYNRRLCDTFLAAESNSSPTVRLYLCISKINNGGGEDIEGVCSAGLSALGQPAAVLFTDPRQAVAAAAATPSSRPSAPVATANAAPADNNKNNKNNSNSNNSNNNISSSDVQGGAILLQFAVILPQELVDTVQGKPSRRAGGGGGGAGGNRAPSEGEQGTLAGALRARGGAGAGAGGPGMEGVSVSAALVDRAVASGRMARVGRGRESSSSSTLDGKAAAAAAAVDGGGGGGGGRAGRQGGGEGSSSASYFILPEKCFSLALPEFHVLCASGAVGEDRRVLDGALSKLSSDNLLGGSPATDLLVQLESKMEDQVKAYLERMQADVTPAEASRLQATQGNMRWKAANVASLKTAADEQRALQEALLCDDSNNNNSGALDQSISPPCR
ncbi:unnamed protein product [Pylaiella littoralis]